MKNVTIRYGLAAITKQVDDGTIIAEIVGDPNNRAVLGYGDNVTALSNSVAMPFGAEVSDGMELVLETLCNTKAQDEVMITIQYGLAKVTQPRHTPCTVRSIVTDANLKASLGFGDNVTAMVNSVAMPPDAQLSTGTTVVLETRCNTKAS